MVAYLGFPVNGVVWLIIGLIEEDSAYPKQKRSGRDWSCNVFFFKERSDLYDVNTDMSSFSAREVNLWERN